MLAAPGTAYAQAQPTPQVPPQVSPPPRSQLTPPEVRRDDRRVTLTIDGDLERAPVLRSVLMGLVGLVAAIWAIGSLVA